MVSIKSARRGPAVAKALKEASQRSNSIRVWRLAAEVRLSSCLSSSSLARESPYQHADSALFLSSSYLTCFPLKPYAKSLLYLLPFHSPLALDDSPCDTGTPHKVA